MRSWRRLAGRKVDTKTSVKLSFSQGFCEVRKLLTTRHHATYIGEGKTVLGDQENSFPRYCLVGKVVNAGILNFLRFLHQIEVVNVVATVRKNWHFLPHFSHQIQVDRGYSDALIGVRRVVCVVGTLGNNLAPGIYDLTGKTIERTQLNRQN